MVPKMAWHDCSSHFVFTFLLISFLNITFLIQQVEGQAQSFTAVPIDTDVIQAHTATLSCSVQNKAGTVQWTKDGFALGAARSLPGYDRYQMTGDEGNGEYSLEITDVQLEDDAMYVCQVSARLGSPAIATAPAHLNVLMAPDPPAISNHDNGTAVTTRPPATVVLTCRCENGKPAPTLTWLQNDQALHYEQPTYVVEAAGDGKREHAVSTLTLHPEEEDNGKEYKCVAEHTALMGAKLFTLVKLSVQFAPSAPAITGYNEGSTIRSGEDLMLRCTAKGGNPLAQVTWWRNDELIDFSYSTDGTQAINDLSIKVGYNDNNARFICRAENVVTPQPMEASTTLTVYFTPEKVNITGYDHAVNAGEQVTLKCTTAQSNPAAFITWWSAGRQIKTHDDIVNAAPKGGFITSQELTVNLTAQTDEVIYTCQATNDELLLTVSDSVTVSVQYPPNPPQISSSGYRPGEFAKARDLLRMVCASSGGNPLATLQWTKNGELRDDAIYDTSGNLATSELSIITDQTDNGAVYTCSASNPATTTPLTTNVTLSVHFVPTHVQLAIIPETSREDDKVTIECKTSSSNPASVISWFRGGVLLDGYGVTNTSIIDAENGGFSTIGHLSLDHVSAADDGETFLCRATNEELSESTNDAVTLSVQYPPVFLTTDNQTLDSHEKIGDFLIDIKLRANPSDVTYVWHKDGKPIDIALHDKFSVPENGSLIIHNVTKNEAGKYRCEASNAEGKRTLFTDLNVWFAPAIQIEDQQIVSMGKTSPLVCSAAANPMPDNFIHWTREGYNISMYQQHYSQGSSTLVLTNITKAHAGPYICHADNGIEPKATKVVQVIAQYAPKIDKSPSRGKVASSAGKRADLVCAAEGAPSVNFKWFRYGKEFNSTKERYNIELFHKTYSVFYESRLTIHNVDEKDDFGLFECRAYNDLGSDTWNINLESTNVPDAISDLREITKTYTSVTLTWTPGFNGGLPQSFHVRYNIRGSTNYLSSDVVPNNATKFVVVGLRPNTKYEFDIRASNELGFGPYGTSLLSVTTERGPIAPPPEAKILRVGEIPFYVIIIVVFVGALCLLLNLCLVFCLIRRHKRKKAATKAEEDRHNIELYKPASSNTYATQPGIGNYDDIDSYESEYDRSVLDYPPRGPPPRGMGFYNDGYRVGQPGPGSYDSYDDRVDDRDMYRGTPDYDYSGEGPVPLPPVPEDRYEGESPPMSEEEEYAEELRRRQADMPLTPTPPSSMYASLPRESIGNPMEGQFV